MIVTQQRGKMMNSTAARQIKVGKWNTMLKTSDVNQIWSELHRIVSSHPLVKASKGGGLLIEDGKYNAYADLTQELFVALLSKDRFQHYIDTNMSDTEIEAEISQLELTNMLTAELRKRYPESYRLARRISTIVQNSKTFKRFDNINHPENQRRLSHRVYGLTEWVDTKRTRDAAETNERAKVVSFHSRDTRMVGCTGDAQIVISNADLEKLIIRVFKAIDSPTDVRSLRSMVMSRLPVMDIYLVPIGGSSDEDEDENFYTKDPADSRHNPEQNLLENEGQEIAVGFVEDFLNDLNKSVRGKSKQYNRMINILWYCYLTSEGGTQLEVADLLGVSDSLISDYRKRIESTLQQISFDGVNEAREFEKVLKKQVHQIIATDGAKVAVQGAVV